MTPAATEFLAALTQRETQIYRLAVTTADSLTDIARQVGTTRQVVRNYMAFIYAKAGCDNRQHLTLWSFRNGAVPCPCGNTP